MTVWNQWNRDALPANHWENYIIPTPTQSKRLFVAKYIHTSNLSPRVRRLFPYNLMTHVVLQNPESNHAQTNNTPLIIQTNNNHKSGHCTNVPRCNLRNHYNAEKCIISLKSVCLRDGYEPVHFIGRYTVRAVALMQLPIFSKINPW
jgi:hypothetical protein